MKIAIIGASGYAGGELIRLLACHSSAEVVCATSRKLAGTPLDQIHPQLKGFTDLKFENPATLPIRIISLLPTALSNSTVRSASARSSYQTPAVSRPEPPLRQPPSSNMPIR